SISVTGGASLVSGVQGSPASSDAVVVPEAPVSPDDPTPALVVADPVAPLDAVAPLEPFAPLEPVEPPVLPLLLPEVSAPPSDEEAEPPPPPLHAAIATAKLPRTHQDEMSLIEP